MPLGSAPRLIGSAFVALTLGSLIWVGIGYLSGVLMAQNIVNHAINLFGIYRWLIGSSGKGRSNPPPGLLRYFKEKHRVRSVEEKDATVNNYGSVPGLF